MINRQKPAISIDALERFRERLYFAVSIFIIVVLLSSCATPAKIIRETSLPDKPSWINRPPTEKDTLYFVGISSAGDTLEQGEKAALKDAMLEISNYLGSEIESVFESYITEVEQKLKHQISSKTSSKVQGAKIVDWYYEKMVRIDKNFRLEKFDVYVLVSFSKTEATKELNRQQQEKEAKTKIAYDYYLNGLNQENNNKYYEARKFYRQALGLITKVKGIVKIDNKNIKNSNDLLLSLKNQLQQVNSLLLRVRLSLNVSETSKASQVFEANFISTLTKHGFTQTDEWPAIEIIGKVSATQSSYLMNNYVFYAEGSISAQRTSDSQTIAVFPFKVKGFHSIKKQAALNALAEAGNEAGEGMAKAILAIKQ